MHRALELPRPQGVAPASPPGRRQHSCTLQLLYRADPRVAPWTETAHGVIQAVNTYEHHEGQVRGDRAERNNLKTINGEFGQLDRRSWQTLRPFLAAA